MTLISMFFRFNNNSDLDFDVGFYFDVVFLCRAWFSDSKFRVDVGFGFGFDLDSGFDFNIWF